MVRTRVRSDARAPALPRSSASRLILRCSSRLAHTAALAAIAGQEGRPVHGAGYLLATIDELQADLVRLRDYVASASPSDP